MKFMNIMNFTNHALNDAGCAITQLQRAYNIDIQRLPVHLMLHEASRAQGFRSRICRSS
jgi:hypothetical protein